MKIQECLNRLIEEKDKGIASRFPCRVVLVKSRAVYQTIIGSLGLLCNKTVSPDDLFSGPDVMPQYDSLLRTMKQGEWLLLPGVSEYLRLFNRSELRSERFGKLWHSMIDAANTGRVLIPLWNCEALWHDKALGLCADMRQNDFVYSIDDDLDTPEKLNILVFSAAFEEYISQLSGKYTLIVGLREWYERLADTTEQLGDYCLLTKQARSIESAVGDITIRVIKDTFAFVRENLHDGHCLTQENSSEEMLNELFEEALKGNSVNEAILHRFNLVTFNGLNIMSGWHGMTSGKRQLLKLWYQLNPDHSYLWRCLTTTGLSEIEDHILLNIFDLMQLHPEWIEESRHLMAALKLKKNAIFFYKLDQLPVYEDRLAFLSISTREERIYILRMVGQWLRQDASQVRSSRGLKKLYPALFEYLQRMPDGIDEVFNDYMSDYKAYKLSNTLPVSEDAFLRGIEPDTLPFRFAILKQYITDCTIILWIDGMGFEYLSLLSWALRKSGNGSISAIALTQATLPTETKFNEQWIQLAVQYEKRDKLDKLAHKGVVDEPDYYACIEEQLSFIESIRESVDRLLESYQRVIITGDHGTSRIAARLFHQREGIAPPKGAIVFSHGRYCQIAGEPTVVYGSLKKAKDTANNCYLVFGSYDHFKIGGFAVGGDEDNVIYGEVHGGASPEEMIVPVIVYDGNNQLPPTAQWQNDTVSMKKRNASAVLKFSRRVSSLQVKVGSYETECQSVDCIVWTIMLKGVEKGSYSAVIVADGKFVDVGIPLTIKPALGGGEGDF